jgi:hypothetical protein
MVGLAKRLDSLSSPKRGARKSQRCQVPPPGSVAAEPVKQEALPSQLEGWLQKLEMPQYSEAKRRIVERLTGQQQQRAAPRAEARISSWADALSDDEGDAEGEAPPIPKQKPASWAALFKKPASPAPATRPAPLQPGGAVPSLWEQAWTCKVTGIKGLAEHPADSPVVVAVRSEAGWQEAELRATSRLAGTTVVWVTAAADGPGTACRVMVRTAKGPVLATARVVKFGDAAPEQVQWQPDAAIDDSKAEEVSLATLRLTVVKEFCDDKLYVSTKAEPHLMTSMLLPAEARQKVLRTKAIAVYDGDIACLLSVRADVKQSLLDAATVSGVVVSDHKSLAERGGDARPSWLPRPADASPADYWKLATDAATQAKGSMAYRPGGRNCLGVHGDVARESVLPPRRAMTGAPKHWYRADVVTWAEARGYSLISAVSQRADAAWSFRGWPPAKADGAKVISFSSGIVLAPDQRGKAKTQKLVATARPSFGSREDKPKAEVKPPVADKPKVDDKPKGVEGPSVAQPVQAGKASAAQNLNPFMPHRELFEIRDCGGQGDCGYTSIAASLSEAAGGRSTAKDLKPGGKLQTELRISAAKEIKAHPERYPAALPSADALAKEVVKNGVYADSMSLMALARACRLELRIFAKGESGWDLYVLRPCKKPSNVTWLVLEDCHYRWCRPKGRIKEEVQRGAVVCDDAGGAKDVCETVAFKTASAPAVVDVPAPGGATKRGLSPDEGEESGGKKNKAALSGEVLATLQTPLDGGGGDGTASVGSNRGSSNDSMSSRRARDLLGIQPAADTDSDENFDEEYHGGEVFRCPKCQWAPATGLKEEKRRVANRHWQRCTGTKPPKLSKQTLRDLRQRSSCKKRRWAPAEARAAEASKKFAELLESLPVEAAVAACQSGFDTPSTRSDGALMFTCSRCFRCAVISKMRSLPCKARSEDMSNVRWQVLVRGSSSLARQRAKQLPRAVELMRAVRKTSKHKEYAKDYYSALVADPVRRAAKNERERVRHAAMVAARTTTTATAKIAMTATVLKRPAAARSCTKKSVLKRPAAALSASGSC